MDTLLTILSPVVSPLLSPPSRFKHSSPGPSPRHQKQLPSPYRSPHHSLPSPLHRASTNPLSPRDVRTLLPDALATYVQTSLPISNPTATASWIRNNKVYGESFMDTSEDVLRHLTKEDNVLLQDLMQVQAAIRGAYRVSTRPRRSLGEITEKMGNMALPTPPDTVLVTTLAEITPVEDSNSTAASGSQDDGLVTGLQLIGTHSHETDATDNPVNPDSQETVQTSQSESSPSTSTSINSNDTQLPSETDVSSASCSQRPVPPRVNTAVSIPDNAALQTLLASPPLLSAVSALDLQALVPPPFSARREDDTAINPTEEEYASTSQPPPNSTNSSSTEEIGTSTNDSLDQHRAGDEGTTTPSTLTGMTLVQHLPLEERSHHVTAAADEGDHEQKPLLDLESTPRATTSNVSDEEAPPPLVTAQHIPAVADGEQPTSSPEEVTNAVTAAQKESHAETTLEKEGEVSLSVTQLPNDPSQLEGNDDSTHQPSTDTGVTLAPSASIVEEEKDTQTSSSSTLAGSEPSQGPSTDQSNPTEQTALGEDDNPPPAGNVSLESLPPNTSTPETQPGSEQKVAVAADASVELADDAPAPQDEPERKDEGGDISATTQASNDPVPPALPSTEETPSASPLSSSDSTTHDENGTAEKPIDQVTVNSQDDSSSPSSSVDQPEIGPNNLPKSIDGSTSTNSTTGEEEKTKATSTSTLVEEDPSHGSSPNQPNPAGKSALGEGDNLPPVGNVAHESQPSGNPIQAPDHIAQQSVEEVPTSVPESKPESEEKVTVTVDVSEELVGHSATSQGEFEHKDGGDDTSTTSKGSNGTVSLALSSAEEVPSVRPSSTSGSTALNNEDGLVEKSITNDEIIVNLNDDDTSPLSTVLQSEIDLYDWVKSIDPSIVTNSVDDTDTEAIPDTEADADDVTKLDDGGTQTADKEGPSIGIDPKLNEDQVSKPEADRITEEEIPVVGEAAPQVAAATEPVIIPPTVSAEAIAAGSDAQITTDEMITETATSNLSDTVSAEQEIDSMTEDFVNITYDDAMNLDEDFVNIGTTPTLSSLSFEQSFSFVSNTDVLLIDLGVEEDDPKPVYPSSALQSWFALLEGIFAMPTPALSFVGELESEDEDVDDFVSVATPRQPPAGLQLTTGCETPRPPVSVDLPPPGGDDKSTEQETDESTGDNAENQQRSVVDAEHVSMSRPQDSMFAPQQPISTLNLSRLQDEPDISPHLTVTSEENPESTAGDSVLATYQLVSQPTEMETITLLPHDTDIPHGKPDDNPVTPTTTSTSDAETIRQLQLRIKDLEARLASAEARSRCRQRTNSDPPPFTRGALASSMV
ncbi:hypothetical protein QCA50_006075 [Cerrena zonata]|uniref:Uncharacterized protein n=1 Tax=Cerrena zonata TaxID=2478898 RepID=A0AAW0GM12_9APHY